MVRIKFNPVGFLLKFVCLRILFVCTALSSAVEITDLKHFLDINEGQLLLPNALFSRTKQYKTKYNKIVIDTIPRTGSILLYNVFRYLFENEENLALSYMNFYLKPDSDAVILFGHGCSDLIEDVNDRVYIISSIRNPEDIIFSYCRVANNVDSSRRPEELVRITGSNVLSHWNRLACKAQRVRNFSFLCFEEFNNDLNKLLDGIESIFKIEIDARDRLIVCSFLKKSAIQAYLVERNLGSFSLVDDLTGFHGIHVDNGEISKIDGIKWRELIQMYLKEDSMWNQICKYYGYK